jgi:hypothetical protein
VPIDIELKEAVHQSIVKHQQQLAVENQLLSLLTELSEEDVSPDRRMQRINLLQTELDISRLQGERNGN